MNYNYKFLLLILLVISIIIFNSYSKRIDGFQNDNSKWSPDLIQRFIKYQQTVNENNTQFDLDILQKQATPEEAEQLLNTGYWPWPEDLKQQYIDKVWSSPIIKIDPQYALEYAMKIYNEDTVREMLAWNTKEGHFLLYGGDIGVTNGMPQNVRNTIKCSSDINGNSVMRKKVYTNMNYWNGYIGEKVTTVEPDAIPKEMPGFSFVKGSCNPCVALNTPGDFSCPFKLNVKEKGNDISDVWKQLWNV
jgi:hypothetical protein